MPPRKRKSESVALPEEADATPAKRTRKPIADSIQESSGNEESKPATPASEGKRGRGRPRKYPPAPPKVTTGPKRGRGRPRKNPEDLVTPKKAKNPGAGRGRPKKTQPEENGVSEEDDAADDKSNSESADAEGEATEENPGPSYWLMKAEPESRLEKGVDVKFSIDDLQAATEPEAWDGVRNPAARHHLRIMKKGDLAFFYHSNCKVPGIVGMMEIVREHSVDESAFDPNHPYYDEKSTREKPKWDVVHVEFRRKFKKQITLNDLKSHAEPGGPLENLQTLKQSRLSVSAVTPKEWEFIMGLVEEGEQEQAASDESSA